MFADYFVYDVNFYVDNCPFPDVPPPRASCKEDATPMQCQDPIFYKRCCQSCNRSE